MSEQRGNALAAIIIVIVAIIIIAGVFLFGFGVGQFSLWDTGERTAETREVSGFKNVSLEGFGNIHIEQGSEEGLEVEAGDKLMDNIIAEVNGDTLEIRYKRMWFLGWLALTSDEAPDFRLKAKDLDKISVSGSGKVSAQELITGSLLIEISGSGEVDMSAEANNIESKISGAGEFNMSGKTDSQEVEISGAGKYLAEGLACDYSDIEISGSGRADVVAKEELRVKISGSGEVNYWGNPAVDQEISGSGKIERRGDAPAEGMDEKAAATAGGVLDDLRAVTGLAFTSASPEEIDWRAQDDQAVRLAGEAAEIGGVGQDEAESIENYFNNNGFAADISNEADGPTGGISGFRKDNIVCLVEKDFEGTDPSELDVKVECALLSE